MYTTETRSPLEMASVDRHVAAARHHEEAAESHRRAAAYFTYEDYQQANEQAMLARGQGKKAKKHCVMDEIVVRANPAIPNWNQPRVPMALRE